MIGSEQEVEGENRREVVGGRRKNRWRLWRRHCYGGWKGGM